LTDAATGSVVDVVITEVIRLQIRRGGGYHGVRQREKDNVCKKARR
jgi:hypothetical protein